MLREAELYRYTDDAPPESLAVLASRFRRLEARHSPDGSQHWLNWAVLNSHIVIGYVQATIRGRFADVAYVIGREYQGRGFASDAAQAMLAYLELVGVRTVYATIDSRNEPSLRLIARLNFTLVDSADERNLRFRKTLPGDAVSTVRVWKDETG